MPNRREFLALFSVSTALASMGVRVALAQTSGLGGKTLNVPSVIDIKQLDIKIKNVDPKIRQAFIKSILATPSVEKEDNCGCNAVCRCNDDTKACCEQKCQCNAKSGSLRDDDLIRTAPGYDDIIKHFNPEEIKEFNQLGSVLERIPAFDQKIPGGLHLGVNDKGLPIAPGNFDFKAARQFYDQKDLNGIVIPDSFISQQLK